jgi:HEAT repeat protein
MGIGLLLGFILLRRAYRHRHFQKLNARTLFYRERLEDVLNGAIPVRSWRSRRLDSEIVEGILLDRLESMGPSEAPRLIEFCRSSGLLDLRLFEARKYSGWRRREALLSLGRMRVPEAVPVLVQALDDASGETRLAAIRSLGRTGLPEAAPPIIEYILRGLPDVAVITALNSLMRCCSADPRILLPYIAQAKDSIRPLLVRVLGELASPDMEEDLLFLTKDSLAEVRASAARSLGFSKSVVALNALAGLTADPEWFVRLRAVAALGDIGDPRAIPSLVAVLCDENRLVRLRTAGVLSHFEDQLQEILRAVIRTNDEYALQAFVAQIERRGVIPKLIDTLVDRANGERARAVLLDILESGAHRMLLDALAHHAQPQVRAAVAKLLAGSSDERLLPQLEALLAEAPSREERDAVGTALAGLKARLFADEEIKAVPA